VGFDFQEREVGVGFEEEEDDDDEDEEVVVVEEEEGRREAAILRVFQNFVLIMAGNRRRARMTADLGVQ